MSRWSHALPSLVHCHGRLLDKQPIQEWPVVPATENLDGARPRGTAASRLCLDRVIVPVGSHRRAAHGWSRSGGCLLRKPSRIVALHAAHGWLTHWPIVSAVTPVRDVRRLSPWSTVEPTLSLSSRTRSLVDPARRRNIAPTHHVA